MKVLLTGATGFLGRYVLASLVQLGIAVCAVGRHPPSLLPGGATFLEADLLAPQSLDELVAQSGATHLLHLAWYAEHGKYWTSPLNLDWVAASIRLADAFCRAGGRKVVMAGTCAEYDWAHGYCRESITPTNPATLYGIAKDATRRLVMAICAQYKVPCVWGRVFIPYGTGESGERLIPSLIDAFRGVRTVFPVNASAYRDFLHVSDVADGLITLACADCAGEYNISSGVPIELGQVVELLGTLMGQGPEKVLSVAAERIGEPRLLVGESSKLRSLGWTPKHTLLEGLSRTVSERTAGIPA